MWLASDGATASQILAEWARVGGTRIVNGEAVAGGPLTLELRGVPELQALDVLLRSTAGFIAAARTPGAAALPPNLSRFDRIVVLPAAARPADRSIRAETASPPVRSPRTFAPPVGTGGTNVRRARRESNDRPAALRPATPRGCGIATGFSGLPPLALRAAGQWM